MGGSRVDIFSFISGHCRLILSFLYLPLDGLSLLGVAQKSQPAGVTPLPSRRSRLFATFLRKPCLLCEPIQGDRVFVVPCLGSFTPRWRSSFVSHLSPLTRSSGPDAANGRCVVPRGSICCPEHCKQSHEASLCWQPGPITELAQSRHPEGAGELQRSRMSWPICSS